MGIIQKIIIKLKKAKFEKEFQYFGGASGFGIFGYGDECKINGAENIKIGVHSWCGRGTDIFVGEQGRLVIGNNFQATARLCIECDADIRIDDNVLVAPNVYICNNKDNEEGIMIGEGVWIGQNASILAGAYIGDHSIIGAGSVVKSKVPRYSIAVGNPAKVVKRWDFDKNDWIKVNS